MNHPTLFGSRQFAPIRHLAARAAFATAVAALATYSAGTWAHGKAHQHGVATMDVALVGQQLSIELETPLDNLLGFERAVRNPAEQARVDAMARTLRTGDTLFKTDAAARCRPTGVELHAPVVGLKAGNQAATPAEAGHADLVATFTFQCEAPAELRQIDVGLFTAFKGFKKIDVQSTRDGRQGKRSLTPASPRLALPG
jgi:hypothetical protein